MAKRQVRDIKERKKQENKRKRGRRKQQSEIQNITKTVPRPLEEIARGRKLNMNQQGTLTTVIEEMGGEGKEI